MNSSQFKRNEFKKLCACIGFKPEIVTNVLSNIDKYYFKKVVPKTNKETGEFSRYKDGTIKERKITPSISILKSIQRSIKDNILSQIELPNEIHGGVKKKSNITNAKPHQGNKFIFTTDLQSFYPNITHHDVFKMFLDNGFSQHYAHWLTKLTTWQFKLPQGTPTSTHISNLVFRDTDLELIELCKKNNITYTRYVDDLTFSSPQDFKHLLNQILEIVISHGFKISYRKTSYSKNQTVTGIVVQLNKIDAPEHIINQSRIETRDNLESKPYTNYIKNIRKAKS
jgi:RNA-directed DNA polymerase